MNNLRWRGWLVAMAIFLVGVAAGSAVTAWMGLRAFRETMRAPAGAVGRADRAAARIGANLTEELKLTPEQAARVQRILDEAAANLRGVRANAAREAAAELRAGVVRIAAELPPEKRAEYRRIVMQRYERLGLLPPGMEE